MMVEGEREDGNREKDAEGNVIRQAGRWREGYGGREGDGARKGDGDREGEGEGEGETQMERVMKILRKES